MNFDLLKSNYDILVQKVLEYEKKYSIKNAVDLLIASKNLNKQQIEFIISNTTHKLFGENKVQDAYEKWEETLSKDGNELNLHFIGKLQKNKVKKAVQLFNVIETIDSEELACNLHEEALNQKKNLKIFLQINIGSEDQKNGILPEEFEKIYNNIRKKDIIIDGIMCIPPKNDDTFFYFGFMKKIARDFGIKNISMGMSNDFETAIKFGTTQIRIGDFITSAPSTEII
ncbi:MAG: pyridoxal phosphate enzyme (YggS family) [Candidatus Midichloriaceae bacterium]|jgi:pyridoxal phosphate enzyme (YggS family)